MSSSSFILRATVVRHGLAKHHSVWRRSISIAHPLVRSSENKLLTPLQASFGSRSVLSKAQRALISSSSTSSPSSPPPSKEELNEKSSVDSHHSAPSGSEATSPTRDELLSSPFPWRSSVEPLPRVVIDDDLSGNPPGSNQGRVIRPLMVAQELGISVFEALFSSGWRYALAEDFSYAFQKGMAGLLSHKYQVPVDKIDFEEEGIRFDSSKLEAVEHNKPPAIETRDLKEPQEEGAFNEKAARLFVNQTIDKNLVELYSKASERGAKLRFEMKPLDNPVLLSAFLVHVLTRSNVESDPSLRGFYSRFERDVRDNIGNNIPAIQDKANELMERTGNDASVRTVIADVLIPCMERFQIETLDDGDGDRSNDSCGSSYMKEVVHLVRFEMLTKANDDGGRSPTHWKIIDWDDLLEGNVWH